MRSYLEQLWSRRAWAGIQSERNRTERSRGPSAGRKRGRGERGEGDGWRWEKINKVFLKEGPL